MTDPAILAAVREAGEAVRASLDKRGCGEICAIAPCACATDAAVAGVKTFLRALPDIYDLPHPADPTRRVGIAKRRSQALAAAVERAGSAGE